MQSYHKRARQSSVQAYHLHPKTQFTVQGDTLRRSINDNERLLVQVPVVALAVPVTVLFDAARKGVQWVVLIDEHGRKYRARLEAFWKHPSFEIDRGFGIQRALPLAAMSDPDAPEPPTQGSLFEVTLA